MLGKFYLTAENLAIRENLVTGKISGSFGKVVAVHFVCLTAILGFANLFHPQAVFAQALSTPKREDAQRTLQERKRDLEQTLRKQKKIQSDVVFLKKERAQLNRKLVDTAGLVKQGEARLSELEGRLAELREQEKLVRGSLARQHGTLKKLLAAMQRMGRNPPPVVVTRRKDALGMVRSAMLLASVFPELRGKALALGEKLSELNRITQTTRRKRDHLRAENRRLADTRLKLKTLVAEKKNRISVRHTELAEIRRTADELSRTVTDLNVLIAKLDQVVAEKSRLGEYQRELARLKPAIDPGIPDPRPGDSLADDSEPTAPAIELAQFSLNSGEKPSHLVKN